MQTQRVMKKFIIYVLLLVFLAAGTKTRLDAAHQVLNTFGTYQLRQAERLTFQTSGTNGDYWMEQSDGQQLSQLNINTLRYKSPGVSYKYSFFFLLCALMLLLTLSRQSREVLTIHSRRYAYRESYIITFIHDTDGPKRT